MNVDVSTPLRATARVDAARTLRCRRKTLQPPHRGATLDVMEWLVDADGRCVPLTAEQAILIDVRATVEDFFDALHGLDQAIQVSSAAVAESRRRRRIRQSNLRLVRAAPTGRHFSPAG